MLLSTWCILAGLTVGAAATELSQAEKEEGFVSIFSGKDLTGWIYEGQHDKVFLAREGELRCNSLMNAPRGNYPAWLRSEKTYENFVLRFDYKIPFYCESGLVIHAAGGQDFGRFGIGRQRHRGAVTMLPILASVRADQIGDRLQATVRTFV